jgi:methylmalonic aciduria homocystinuria type C protein
VRDPFVMEPSQRGDYGMVWEMSTGTHLLAAAGLDIAHAFDARAVDWLAGRERCGLLIGNTRALWPVFCEAMRDPALAAHEHPLDHYVEQTIERAFPAARVFYSHRRYGEAYLPFQQLAVATGLGALSEGGLVIHPVYGPWLALRAVILVDDEPVSRSPCEKPCHCDATCSTALARALDGGDWRAWLAVRDACTLREHRYSDEQIRYHYTKAWER